MPDWTAGGAKIGKPNTFAYFLVIAGVDGVEMLKGTEAHPVPRESEGSVESCHLPEVRLPPGRWRLGMLALRPNFRSIQA